MPLQKMHYNISFLCQLQFKMRVEAPKSHCKGVQRVPELNQIIKCITVICLNREREKGKCRSQGLITHLIRYLCVMLLIFLQEINMFIFCQLHSTGMNFFTWNIYCILQQKFSCPTKSKIITLKWNQIF